MKILSSVVFSSRQSDRFSWIEKASALAALSASLAATLGARNLVFAEDRGTIIVGLCVAGAFWSYRMQHTGAAYRVNLEGRRMLNTAIVILTGLAVWAHMVEVGAITGWLNFASLDLMRISVFEAIRILLVMILWLTAFRSFTLFNQRDLLLTLIPGLSILLLVCVLEPAGQANIYVVWFAVSGWFALAIDQRLRMIAFGWARPREVRVKAIVPDAQSSLASVAVVLAGACILSAILTRWLAPPDGLQRTGIKLAWYLARFMVDTSRTPFSGYTETTLSTVEPAPPMGKKIVFRVRSRVAGYWRGRAYDEYDGAFWRSTQPVRQIVTSNSDDGPSAKVYPVSLKQDSSAYERVAQTFMVEALQMGTLHCLPFAETVYAPVQRVRVSAHRSVTCPKTFMSGEQYTVVSRIPRGARNHAISQDDRDVIPSCLVKPSTITERVKLLAKRLTRSLKSDETKAEAIRNYLSNECSYSLSIWPFPKGYDAVDYFLFEARSGYCIQFATAMTALCRCVGIPARLVTGYCTGEHDPITQSYIVRESDAHAWVEVFLQDKGWVQFDPTPDYVTRRETSISPISAVRKFMERSAENLLNKCQSIFDRWIQSPFRSIAILLSLVSIVCACEVLRHRVRGGRMAFRGSQETARLMEIENAFCAQISRGFRPRQPSETLLEYALAATEAHIWLQRQARSFAMNYDRARYGPIPPNEADFHSLWEVLHRWGRELSQ